MHDIKDGPEPRRPFHWRGLTSFLVALGFLLLAVTGVILYLTPQCRVAHWTDWRLAGLDKDQWAAVHMLSGILFLIAAVFHLYFNWAVFVHYIKRKAGFNLKREMAVALGVVALLVAGTLWNLPPFSYVVDANERIKTYWDDRGKPAPYPHAEASTIEDFANRMDIPLEEIQSRLAGLGLAEPEASLTLAEASSLLRLTPSALYEKLGLAAAPKMPRGRSARRGGGSGWRGGSGW